MPFSNPVFETPLDLRREIKAVERDGARVEGILLAPYSVSFNWDDDRWRFTIPKGFQAAPSIPTELQMIVPIWGGIFEPSIIHDWCYWTRCFDPLVGGDGKEAADDLFLELMQASGVGWFNRNAAHAAVAVFGRDVYDANTFKANSGPVKVVKI